MKRTTILLKKTCKSINLLLNTAVLCWIAVFLQLKNLKKATLTNTMI